MKKVGFYGGKFYPFHFGHLYCMIVASKLVDHLYVVVCSSEIRDKELIEGTEFPYVDGETRANLIREIVDGIDHDLVFNKHKELGASNRITVINIDDGQSEEDYDWKQGSLDIKEAIGEDIDMVFSSEHSYDETFKELYPESEHYIIDPDRDTFNTSGTKIRNSSFNYDDFPEPSAYFYQKLIPRKKAFSAVLVGTESCGKSVLARDVSALLNMKLHFESGRYLYHDYVNKSGRIKSEQELYDSIIFDQSTQSFTSGDRIVDSEAITTKFYAELYGANIDFSNIERRIKEQEFDVWFLLTPDVEWVPDGDRQHSDDAIRWENHWKFKEMLDSYGIDYIVANGSYLERFENVFKEIKRRIK